MLGGFSLSFFFLLLQFWKRTLILVWEIKWASSSGIWSTSTTHSFLRSTHFISHLLALCHPEREKPRPCWHVSGALWLSLKQHMWFLVTLSGLIAEFSNKNGSWVSTGFTRRVGFGFCLPASQANLENKNVDFCFSFFFFSFFFMWGLWSSCTLQNNRISLDHYFTWFPRYALMGGTSFFSFFALFLRRFHFTVELILLLSLCLIVHYYTNWLTIFCSLCLSLIYSCKKEGGKNHRIDAYCLAFWWFLSTNTEMLFSVAGPSRLQRSKNGRY